MDFGTISEQVKVIKKNNLLYTRQRRDKTEEITRLTEENGSIKKNIFNEREKQIDIQKELNLVDTDIQNWTIVQNVLNHKETIKLVKDLIEELEQIERELYYISKIEQRPAIINFLKLDDYKELSEWEKQHFETELEEVRARRRQTENKYNEEKSAFGEREQQVIELRKIGKTLMTDARCPLCGHEYSTTQQLINIIDNDNQKKIQQNEQREEILRSEIHSLESQLEALDMDINRELEQALENLKTKFKVSDTDILGEWVSKYHTVYDKCELEVERLEALSSVIFERQVLEEYKATIKKDEPMVERCARAVQAFEKMPSLSSFVEKGIRNNIQQISKFFKWMHHSGEFEKLDIDDRGIYAVRGLNNQEVRTYEMSTGQRSTIAMAVMFALHMAAPDAPQFLLLDEPLATMDDTQVLNVLDILKSMAERNTQIFFTTANSVMINLFKECFKNTTFDYKEYQFIKRVNRPSEIRESNINDTKSIEELTLDDLTLDFHQFAQIRNILRRNQEKLVARDEWEVLPEETNTDTAGQRKMTIDSTEAENFYMILDSDERRILDVLVADRPDSIADFLKLVSPFPNYKTILERINEKALDFYEETIINTDEMLPYVEEDYLDELKEQNTSFYDKNRAENAGQQKR